MNLDEFRAKVKKLPSTIKTQMSNARDKDVTEYGKTILKALEEGIRIAERKMKK